MNINSTTKDHVCHRNFEGTTGLEAASLVQEFKRNEEIQGMRH